MSGNSSSNSSSQGRGAFFKRLLNISKPTTTDDSGLEKSKPDTNFLLETSTSGNSAETACTSSNNKGVGRARLLMSLAKPEKVKETTYIETKSNTIKITESLTTLCIEPQIQKTPIQNHGTKGTPTDVLTNYIRLTTVPTKGVFQYDVLFNPNVDSRDFRFKYLNQHRDTLGNTKLFDGQELCLPFQLPNLITQLQCSNIADGSPIEMTIRFKRKKLFGECTQLYNNLFNKILKILKYVRFGRKQFDPTAPIIIPQHKLEIWPGYVTAVDDYEGGVMLCLDVSHKVLCRMNVFEYISDIYYNFNDNSQFQENCLRSLLGQVVITRYNNKLYRIDNIDFEMNPTSTFDSSGESVTFADYYKRQYNITIKDLKQPLLISRKERFINGQDKPLEIILCLIPELCYLSGLSDPMRADTRLMRDIAAHTRVTPNQRINALRIFCENVRKSDEAKNVLQSWGLCLDDNPLSLIARQLNIEKVTFRKKEDSVGANADFSRSLNNEVLEAIDIHNWLLIHTKNDSRSAKSFIDCIERNAKPMGINIGKPKFIILNDDRTESYVKILRENIRKDTQIVVLIVPTIRDDRYSAIKKICCAEIPVASQVIISRTLSNEAKNRSIVQKIALQMNCKLGGTLWSVKIPFSKVMICGIDTYHDPKQKNKSVSAFVASLDEKYTRWYSRATIQSKKEEFLIGLCLSMTNSLNVYKERNGYLPDKIIIFRDGVGDGQLKICEEYEIPQVKDACTKAGINYNPTFTFIVVQKRINTRIFAINNKNEITNPLPGCVLDTQITRKYLYDFFLVAQNVRQGAVTPTHYIVVMDTANFKPDILQQLSYKMCFLYYNWPGSVRVPACCQYAHKLAYLIGECVRRETSEKLADKLFFL